MPRKLRQLLLDNCYVDKLEAWLAFFPADRFLLVRSEDLRSDNLAQRQAILDEITEFLGVGPHVYGQEDLSYLGHVRRASNESVTAEVRAPRGDGSSRRRDYDADGSCPNNVDGTWRHDSNPNNVDGTWRHVLLPYAPTTIRIVAAASIRPRPVCANCNIARGGTAVLERVEPRRDAVLDAVAAALQALDSCP